GKHPSPRMVRRRRGISRGRLLPRRAGARWPRPGHRRARRLRAFGAIQSRSRARALARSAGDGGGARRRVVRSQEGEPMITRLFALMLGTVVVAAGAGSAAAQQFTAWGWPQPYEQVSQKSIDWLKQQGWWPLQYGYQAPWLGQATIPLVVKDSGLDKKRGLDVQLQSFLAGPPLNEAIVAGKIQIGVGGNFPLTTLIVRKAPVHSPGI